MTDESGNEVGRAAYDPYGNLIANTIPLTLTERLFTGQIWEDGIQLYNYRARFYDPLTGSFTQPDSLVPDPLDPRAWNRFGYVYGNPANFTDPSGHNPLLIAAGIGLFALGGFGGHLAATSAGYEVGSAQWYGAVGLGGAFAVASGGLGYYGFGGWALAVGIVGDTIIDTAVLDDDGTILDDDFLPLIIQNTILNVVPDVVGYTVGRTARYLSIPKSIRGGKGFKTFEDLKDYLEPAGRYRAWHHIVEQNTTNRAQFPPEWIHNTKNVVNIPSGYSGSLHSKINAVMSSKDRIVNVKGWRIRDTVSEMSFDEQYEFGIDLLRQQGYNGPLP